MTKDRLVEIIGLWPASELSADRETDHAIIVGITEYLWMQLPITLHLVDVIPLDDRIEMLFDGVVFGLRATMAFDRRTGLVGEVKLQETS